MGILLRHDDNEHIFVATIMTIKTITTIGKLLSKKPLKKDESPVNEWPAFNMSLELK